MDKRERRRARIREIIRGTKERPRLVVFRSNRYIYAQLVDDRRGESMAAVNKATDSYLAGKEIAQAALEKGIKEVVFDRAGYKYHGNIKKLAEAARQAGLVF